MKIFTNAKKPLLIYGQGVHLAGAEHEAVAIAHQLQIPVVCTWAAVDLFRWDDPGYVGCFGTHGVRAANWAVQNADVIVSIGSRLDTKATGSPPNGFAPKAVVHMVEVDQSEIDKFQRLGREVRGHLFDAKDFLLMLGQQVPEDWIAWRERIADWKRRYPPCTPEYTEDNPYRFVDRLSDMLHPDDVIVSDTGCPVGWMAQAFRFTGQRFLHAFNNTPMGYGLPAAIGASFATDKRIICITGDGGLGENVTEFATLARHNCNVKVILFNNAGHQMCVATEDTWFGGKHAATNYAGGLATPDFVRVAAAYDIPIHSSVESLLAAEGMGFYEYRLSPNYKLDPQVRADKPLEDACPFIPREELAEIMSI